MPQDQNANEKEATQNLNQDGQNQNNAGGGNEGNPAAGGGDGKPAAKTSIYDDLGVDDPAKSGKAPLWPDNWRDQFQGAGKPEGKDFANMDSPVALAKSYLALKQRISSGEFKRAVPMPTGATATPEAIAQWRTDNNVPTEATQYDIMPAGVKLDSLDADGKSFIAGWQDIFHKSNLPKEVAAQVAQGAFDLASKQMEGVAQADAVAMDKTDDALRSSWGADYKANLKINVNFVKEAFGPDVGEMFFEARLPSGEKLGNVPGISEAINRLARAGGGDALVGSDTAGGKTVDARIGEIENIMQKDLSQYTAAMATEYGELLGRREAGKR